MQAKNIMSTNVISISPLNDLKTAALKMRAHDISGMPVIDPSGGVAGIITEGDLLRCIAGDLADHSREEIERLDPQCLTDSTGPYRRTVEDVMTKAVVSVDTETKISEIARILIQRRIKRVLVVQHTKVIGVVSRCDVMAAIIDSVAGGARPADREVLRQLRDRLRNETDIELSDLDITVSNAQVYIRGRLKTEAQRTAFRTILKTIGGIDAITEQTTVAT